MIRTTTACKKIPGFSFLSRPVELSLDLVESNGSRSASMVTVDGEKVGESHQRRYMAGKKNGLLLIGAILRSSSSDQNRRLTQKTISDWWVLKNIQTDRKDRQRRFFIPSTVDTRMQ